MNQKSGTATRHPLAHTDHLTFSTLFPTTRHGAHTARLAAEHWLAPRLSPDDPRDDDLTTAALLVAELCANAALYGRVRGRGARLALRLDTAELRIEVTDARGDRLPTAQRLDSGGESGRGLLLVESLSDDWGVRPHHPGGKTVWAVCRRQDGGPHLSPPQRSEGEPEQPTVVVGVVQTGFDQMG
ncbi:ATP-binding protein [Streptomyces exfoliatus]|uniref:ATP-binding protein n=1 Tax=Streptomyces exfoliatus TaxID=1905 RepID=A0ABV3D416_STREX